VQYEGPKPRAFLVSDDEFFVSRFYQITPDEMSKVKSLQSDLYMIGYVDYTDQFDQDHRGGYARQYWPMIDSRRSYKTEEEFAQRNNLTVVAKEGYNYDRVREILYPSSLDFLPYPPRIGDCRTVFAVSCALRSEPCGTLRTFPKVPRRWYRFDREKRPPAQWPLAKVCAVCRYDVPSLVGMIARKRDHCFSVIGPTQTLRSSRRLNGNPCRKFGSLIQPVLDAIKPLFYALNLPTIFLLSVKRAG
jgi:hypothetical protein